MQVRLLDILRCPLSGEKLTLHVDHEVAIARQLNSSTPLAFGDTSEISREIVEGKLIAESSKHVYPIVAGVPRMLVDKRLSDPTLPNRNLMRPDSGLSQEYQQTVGHFRTQWATFGEDTKSFGRSVEGSWKYFRENYVLPSIPDEWFRGRLVVDAGCGHGKYIDAFSMHGIDVVGLDITPEIERVHQRVGSRPNVNLVHGNILHPPFANNFADI